MRVDAISFKTSPLFILVVLVFALYPIGSAFSDQYLQDEPSRINAYSIELDRYADENRNSKIIFADTASGYPDSKVSWRGFASDEELDKADTGENLNEIAKVWLRSGHVAICSYRFQSPSRDWINYANYYFRADGTLAKIYSTLNTFYGNIRRVRVSYYSSSGTLLKDSVEYFDLNTGIKKKPDENFFDEQIPLYKTVAALPFYKLLIKTRK